jgi:hypothetical protein
LDEFAKQNEVRIVPGNRSVNVAVAWGESELPHHGMSHRRAEKFFYSIRLTIAVSIQPNDIVEMKKRTCPRKTVKQEISRSVEGRNINKGTKI